jgi:hypothetical protein
MDSSIKPLNEIIENNLDKLPIYVREMKVSKSNRMVKDITIDVLSHNTKMYRISRYHKPNIFLKLDE